MHNNEYKGRFLAFSTRVLGFFSILFWVLLIYGFEEPYVAGVTVIAAVIHELGHIAVIGVSGGGRVRGALSGLRIRKKSFLSYKEDFRLAAAGPLANTVSAAAALPFLGLSEEYVGTFISVSLATAAANLLPVRGNDGYNMIFAVLAEGECAERGFAVLNFVSRGITLSLCVVALYLMDRVGEGYWIFAVFYLSLLGELGRGLQGLY